VIVPDMDASYSSRLYLKLNTSKRDRHVSCRRFAVLLISLATFATTVPQLSRIQVCNNP
jgi:hypothetical protein